MLARLLDERGQDLERGPATAGQVRDAGGRATVGERRCERVVHRRPEERARQDEDVSGHPGTLSATFLTEEAPGAAA